MIKVYAIKYYGPCDEEYQFTKIICEKENIYDILAGIENCSKQNINIKSCEERPLSNVEIKNLDAQSYLNLLKLQNKQ